MMFQTAWLMPYTFELLNEHLRGVWSTHSIFFRRLCNYVNCHVATVKKWFHHILWLTSWFQRFSSLKLLYTEEGRLWSSYLLDYTNLICPISILQPNNPFILVWILEFNLSFKRNSIHSSAWENVSHSVHGMQSMLCRKRLLAEYDLFSSSGFEISLLPHKRVRTKMIIANLGGVRWNGVKCR